MASLTGQLVAETYKALLKLIDNDILTASEKQITDGFGGGSNVFIDSQGFLRANKYKITNGLATQFLKADGSLDSNAYLTSITGAQVITALGYTPVPTTRTITINGETHNLAADNSWTVGGTAAIWGNITGTLSNQTDLQNALNAKYNNPTGTISQYIRGDGTIANFPALTGYVPYSGATSNVNLGEYGLTAGFVGFDTTPTGTPTGIGTLYWDSANRTLSLIDGDGDTTLQIGQEERVLVHNNTGATLTDGQVVYVTGSTGELPSVALASNSAEATSSVTFGMVTESIAHGADGFITTSGIVHGLNTLAFTEGAALWLGTTPGTFTQTKPVAPLNSVLIGYVIKKAGGNGSVFVKIQNGYELEELHDVYIADPANNHGIFYDIADGLWKNKSIASALGYTPQAQLSGTGFVKASGTTITYDNSTYLTTTDAASTYQRLDKMVSNLLPSATEYPNSNAVIAALALKADALNPVFTGYMTISGAEPKLYFTDTDQNPDYFIGADAGFFRIYDQTAGATRFVINSSGVTTIAGDLIVGTIAKSGGTATQFLKADGSVDSTDYATVASLANYLLSATAATTYQTLANLSTDLTTSATKYPSVNAVNAGLATKQPLDADLTAIAGLAGTTGFLKKTAADTWTLDTSTYLTTGDASTTYLAITTAASTYQRLDKMVSNLLPSSTEYPNSNAVINALVLKANAANPVFTGDLSISGATPRLYFVDTDQNPDYTVFIDSGFFYIYDQTAGATRFSINSSGNINTGVGKSITAGSFVKESGTSSQYLMADGSVSTLSGLVTGSGTGNYITKWATGSTVGNSIIYDNGSSVGIGGTTLTKKLEVITGNGVTDGIRLTYANGITAEGMDITYLNSGATTTSFDSLYNSAAAVMQFRMKTAATPVTAMTIFGSGNISTGTVVDSGYSFDINGTLRVQNNASFSGTGRFYNTLTFRGGDRGFECADSGGLSIYSNEINSGSQGVAGDLYLGYRRTNRTYIISPLTVSSAATFNSTITSGNIGINTAALANTALRVVQNANDNWIAGFSNNNVSAYGVYIDHSSATSSSIAAFQVYTPTGTGLKMQNNGRLLLGSFTDNGYTLQVYGNAYFPNLSISNVGELAFNSSAYNIYTYGRTGLPNAGRIIFNNGTGQNLFFGELASSIYGFTAGGYNSTPGLTMDMANYRVGIGTTSPVRKMDIVTTGEQLRIAYDTSGSVYTDFRNDSAGGLLVNTSGGYIIHYIAGSPIMRMNANGNVLIGTSTDSGYKLNVVGQAIAVNNGTTAELRLQGGGYNTAYNTSLRSIAGAIGILQFGNNGDNYILVGNTATGSNLQVRVNCNSESVASGTAAMRIDNTAATTFYSSVTATSFFESSDLRLKTLIESNAIIDGIEKLEAKLYEKNGKIELGYFAQDAEKIMPYAVSKNDEGFLNLSYREIHTAKIARLEKEVAELKAQLNLN